MLTIRDQENYSNFILVEEGEQRNIGQFIPNNM